MEVIYGNLMTKVKKPRLVKSKEEVLAQLRKSADWNKKMDFTKNKFWPALLTASKSIDDATIFLSSLSTMIMQEFLASMKQKTFGELNFKEKLNKEDSNFTQYSELLDLFNYETIFDSKELIEGMRNEINLFVQEELKDRPLSSLKAKWLDEK